MKGIRDQMEFESKRQELKMLIDLHKQEYIDLYFADESHFGLTPNVPYAWQLKGDTILLPAKKAQRLTLFGLMTIDCKLEAYTAVGSLNSIKLIEHIDQFCQTINKKTVIVLDNAPIHKSKLFKAKIKEWQKLDLFIYFLPTYSPELNKIEILWGSSNTNGYPLMLFLTSKISKNG